MRTDPGRVALPGLHTLLTLAVAIAVMAVAPASLAQTDACPEPNDNQASACALASGAAVQSFVERPGDVDVFQFEVPGPGQVSLELTDLPADYDLYLTDANGGVLGQSVHEGTATEQLHLAVQPGTYYAVVQADPSREVDASRPYTVRLSVSAAQAPVPLAQPAASVAGRRVFLADNFDDPRGGFLPTTSSNPALFALGYVDGEYSIRNLDPSRGFQGIILPGTYDDVTLSVDLRLVGEGTGRQVTVACRRQFPEPSPIQASSYRLVFYPETREVELVRSDLGRATSLIPRRPSPAINRGDQGNRFELSCHGSTILVRANDTEIGSVQDSTYASGRFFVGIGAPGAGPTPIELRMDNLVVYGP